MVRAAIPLGEAARDTADLQRISPDAEVDERTRNARRRQAGDCRENQYFFRSDGTEPVCTWPGCDPAELCWRLAGFIGINPRGLTLRQLWLMAHGRLEQCRRLLWSHRHAIATLFDGDEAKSFDVKVFAQYGMPGSGAAEPRISGVDDKVSKFLRDGKVTFE